MFKERYRISLRIPTPENWSGTFEDGTVEIFITINNCTVSVYAHGTDDFAVGFYRIFENKERSDSIFWNELNWASKLAFITSRMIAERYCLNWIDNSNGYNLTYKPSPLSGEDIQGGS